MPNFAEELTAQHLERTEHQLRCLQTCLCATPPFSSSPHTPARPCADRSVGGTLGRRLELEAVVRAVERAGANAGQLLAGAGGSVLPAASCALAAGATPSLAQCVEGLQDIWCALLCSCLQSAEWLWSMAWRPCSSSGMRPARLERDACLHSTACQVHCNIHFCVRTFNHGRCSWEAGSG